MEEIWKPIITDRYDYTGCYEVSNFGRIRSLNYYGVPGKIGMLKLKLENTGYYRVALCIYNTRIYYSVHRLVKFAFDPIENPSNYEVNHLDENPLNNKLENLEWCTKEYNIRYSQSKTIIQLTFSGEVVAKYLGVFELPKEFNKHCVSRCCRGVLLQYKGYLWLYEEDFTETIVSERVTLNSKESRSFRRKNRKKL